MDTISTIDFSHPWWVPGLSLDDSDDVYFAFNDASLSLYKDLYVMFFNQSIIKNYQFENPYDLVDSGKWTLDAFLGIAKDAGVDLNGDGLINPGEDQFPYVAKHAANRAFITSTETSLFGQNDTGTTTLLGISENLVNVFEKLRPFLSNKELAFLDREADVIKLSQSFIDGKTLFLLNCMMAVEGMRNMSDDYGIVPVPKYDEQQTACHSQIATSTSAIYIPITSDNIEMLGTVMEVLGYYSWLEVVPTYYETALNVKYARDDRVQKMLALVRDSATTSIDFAYGWVFATYNVFNKAAEGEELASWYAGIESSVTEKLEKYLAIDLEA